MRIEGVALMVVAVAAGACGGKGGGAVPGDGGGGSGGGDNDAAQDTAPADTGGPPITSAPDEWSRPADCHGIGEMCNGLGCGSGGMCQLEGYVCVPRLVDINNAPGRTAETPYCLAFSCMTYEQASCFCTGPAGKMYPACKTGPAAVAGLCVGETSSCSSATCCKGLDCVSVPPNSKICYDRCAGNTDCDTGCCTDRRDTGDLVCAPLTSCEAPCTRRGQTCTAHEQCCNGLCVMDPNPDWNGCRPSCSSNAECDTGCCKLFANSAIGFCTTAGYCGCGAGCATGSTCTTFDGKNFACRADCTQHTDCTSQCCSGNVTGTNHGVCVTDECTCPGGCMPGQTCGSTDSGATYSCLKNCVTPSDCPSGCCSQLLPGKNYGYCYPAAACGL